MRDDSLFGVPCRVTKVENRSGVLTIEGVCEAGAMLACMHDRAADKGMFKCEESVHRDSGKILFRAVVATSKVDRNGDIIELSGDTARQWVDIADDRILTDF